MSPERLANPRFKSEVFSVIEDKLGLIVIDEAHCISSWGHDFRPDYQRFAQLLAKNGDLPILCTTATASKRVSDDIAQQLGPDTLTLRGQLTRDSLHLAVVQGLRPVQHFSWVDEALHHLEGSGIIYSLTVNKVQQLANYLTSVGHNVAAYYGAVENEERLRIEDALMKNELKAVVATSALGMGYDKPDVAFCIHVGCPSTAIDYYQQVGRAGRGLDHAAVALLTDQLADKRLWEWFATSSIPKKSHAEAIVNFLKSTDTPVTEKDVVNETNVPRGRASLLLRILAVEGVLEKTEQGWEYRDVPWKFDELKYEKLVESRRRDASIMSQYADAHTCLETQLRVALDDDVERTNKCGRCSVCTGCLPYGLPETPTMQTTSRATKFLRNQEYPIEPRKRWPMILKTSGNVSSTQIPLKEQLFRGKSLSLGLDDPIWGEVVEDFLNKSRMSNELEIGIDEMLGRWKSNENFSPTLIVPIPSQRNSAAVWQLADFTSGAFGVPVLKVVSLPKAEDTNENMRVKKLFEGVEIDQVKEIYNQRILLVGESVSTRWTITVITSHLYRAGAESVSGFVLREVPVESAQD